MLIKIVGLQIELYFVIFIFSNPMIFINSKNQRFFELIKIENLTFYLFYKNSVMLMLATSSPTAHNLSLSPIATLSSIAAGDVRSPLAIDNTPQTPAFDATVSPPVADAGSLRRALQEAYGVNPRPFRRKIQAVLDYRRSQPPTVKEHNPWSVHRPTMETFATWTSTDDRTGLVPSPIMIPEPNAEYVSPPTGARTPRAPEPVLCELCESIVHNSLDEELCRPCDEYLRSMAGVKQTPSLVPIGVVSMVPTFACALCRAPDVCASAGDYCVACTSDFTEEQPIFPCLRHGIPEDKCNECERCPHAVTGPPVPVSMAAPFLAPLSAVPFDSNQPRLSGTITPMADEVHVSLFNVPNCSPDGAPFAAPENADED